MASEQPKSEAAPQRGKVAKLTPILIVAALMLAEGVAVFFLAQVMSPAPPSAEAETADAHGGHDSEVGSAEFAEVELAECRPSNKITGKLVTFHIRVSALVAAKDHERVTALAQSKKATLEDAVNVIIRSTEPVHINEPGLETLRRRLQHEFDRIFNDDQLIRQVLIPQLLQSGPGV